MTGFVDRINTANQSIDRNKKLLANLAGKSHCDTVERTKTKLSDVMAMRCLLDSGDGQYAEKVCQRRDREKSKR